ncbi:hypothetical protein V6N13_129064 [Hibiscus sabdariffa]|uniref:Uncharacterized protein n=1 Tax=Hibiscus sabdariffa TaxID=183260 RepID=A0ABR2SKZ2_9ROSI
MSRSLSPVKVEGIEEENLLEPRNKFLKEMRLPKQEGIGPDNLLLVKNKKANLFRLHNSVGIDPSKLFSIRERLCSSSNPQIEAGMLPFNLSLSSWMFIKRLKLTISLGMPPLMLHP